MRPQRRSTTRDCNLRRSEPSHSENDLLDQGQLREAGARGPSCPNCRHGRIDAAPSLSSADPHEPPAISKAVTVAGRAWAHACRWYGCLNGGLCGRIRKRQPVQSGIQPLLRPRRCVTSKLSGKEKPLSLAPPDGELSEPLRESDDNRASRALSDDALLNRRHSKRLHTVVGTALKCR